jgi:hypothetical protein
LSFLLGKDEMITIRETPKKSSPIIAVILALVGTALFTILLVIGKLSEGSFVVLLGMLSLTCIVLPVLPRLRELDLRSLRLTLNEIKAVKAEIEDMYGGIEHLRSAPLVLDKEKMERLGLDSGHIATAGATMRYPAGCIKRERERLASIFVSNRNPEELAKAILDNSMDDLVFKWNGPEAPLHQAPSSVEDRKKTPSTPDTG